MEQKSTTILYLDIVDTVAKGDKKTDDVKEETSMKALEAYLNTDPAHPYDVKLQVPETPHPPGQPIRDTLISRVVPATRRMAMPVIMGARHIEFKGLSGYPGDDTEWFLKSVDNEKMHAILDPLENTGVIYTQYYAYCKSFYDQPIVISESVAGKFIFPPKQKWISFDDIFFPKCGQKCLSEMTAKERAENCPQTMAAKTIALYIRKPIEPPVAQLEEYED